MKIISFPPVADVGMILKLVIFWSFDWPIVNNLVFWLVTLGNSIVPFDREMLKHALVTNKESKIHSDWSFIFSLQATMIERGKSKINQKSESVNYYQVDYKTELQRIVKMDQLWIHLLLKIFWIPNYSSLENWPYIQYE